MNSTVRCVYLDVLKLKYTVAGSRYKNIISIKRCHPDLGTDMLKYYRYLVPQKADQ